MKKTFLFLAALAMSAMTWAATGDLLCGGSFIGSFPNSETWTGSDEDYYSGNGYKFDQNETLQSPNLIAGVKKVKIRILVGHNGGATSTLTVGAFDSEGSQLSISENIVPTVAYTAQTDDAIQEFILDGDGVSDIKYVLISFTKVKNYGMKTFEVYDATGTATVTLDSLVIKGKATKMEYEVGEAFDTDGLEVWGIYTKTVKHDSTSQIKSGITWSIDPETFEEASDNASVTLVASYKDLTTADTTITGINVKAAAPLPKYATIYTSNVTLSTTGGTSATAAKVVVAKGDTVDALKAGTGSAAGSVVVSIPAATKTLHFHVVGWSGKSVELDINGEALAITSDAGISNNSPFTLKGTASDYYYTIDPKGATSITFKATKDNRFVLFGVNAELEEGTVAAPSFEPTATDFDQEVEVTLTADEGAYIFYTLDGSTPDGETGTLYTAPFTLTATTTVKAVARKDGKDSERVEKTYTLVPAYTVEELAAITPTGQKAVLVLDNDEIVEIYAGKSGDISGLYFQATEKKIELYNQNYAFSKDWVVGGKVSGRVMGEWVDFKGTWELKIATEEIEKLTYTAPGEPTRINNAKAAKKATKAIVDGQIMIIRDNRTYNVLGF